MCVCVCVYGGGGVEACGNEEALSPSTPTPTEEKITWAEF